MLDKEPESFYKGDTVKWYKHFDSDKFPIGFDKINYYFASGDFVSNVKASDNGDGKFVIDISSQDSSLWPSGDYEWQCKGTLLDGGILTVGSGTMIVYGSLTERSSKDRETTVNTPKRIIEAIDAHLSDPNNLKCASITIRGKSISRYGIRDLMDLRNYYEEKLIQNYKRDNRLSLVTTRKIVVKPQY